MNEEEAKKKLVVKILKAHLVTVVIVSFVAVLTNLFNSLILAPVLLTGSAIWIGMREAKDQRELLEG